MLTTVASGSNSAVEWYSREYDCVPPEPKVWVTGSNRSARLPGWSGASMFSEPPEARILPLGSMVAFMWILAVDIFGPGVQAGEAAERSIISVVRVAGLGCPPPKFITF